jgi:DNA uptake protein ComE-like DNA-binding protein
MSRDLWEILNSLWIILTFTYFTNWIAFIYIGATTRNRKWIFYGLAYLAPFIITQIVMDFYVDPSMVNENGVISDTFTSIVGYLFMIPWLISIGHAFYVRKEYLLRLESLKRIQNTEELHFQQRLKEMKDVKERDLKRNLRKEYNLDYYESIGSTMENPLDKNINKTISKELPSLLVDINNDSEEKIAKLPGVGIILAKKAVELRQTSPFESVEEFGEALDIKPHVLERIRPSVVIGDSRIPVQKSGRLVDV